MSFPRSPKTDFLAKAIVPDKTIVVSDEDREFWKAQKVRLNVGDIPPCDLIVFGEWLQKVDDPVQMLKDAKQKASKFVITVPYEYGWNESFKPFKNEAHKRFYDTDMLASHLEEAGLQYTIKLIEFSGWSFFGCECTIENSSNQ